MMKHGRVDLCGFVGQDKGFFLELMDKIYDDIKAQDASFDELEMFILNPAVSRGSDPCGHRGFIGWREAPLCGCCNGRLSAGIQNGRIYFTCKCGRYFYYDTL